MYQCTEMHISYLCTDIWKFRYESLHIQNGIPCPTCRQILSEDTQQHFFFQPSHSIEQQHREPARFSEQDAFRWKPIKKGNKEALSLSCDMYVEDKRELQLVEFLWAEGQRAKKHEEESWSVAFIHVTWNPKPGCAFCITVGDHWRKWALAGKTHLFFF